MARVEIAESVLVRGPNRSVLVGSGATVQVNHRSGGAPATIYDAATGPGVISNPLTSNSEGMIEGWLEAGSYDLEVTLESETYTQRYEAVSGDDTGALVSVYDYGAAGDGVTDDTAALSAAAGDSLALDFGDGHFRVDLTVGVEIRTGAVLRGSGARISSLQDEHEDPGGLALLYTQSGASFEMHGIELQGPTVLIDDDGGSPTSSSSEVYLVQLVGSGATLKARDCIFRNASFYIWCSSDNTGVDLEGCELVGWSGATKCTGILFSGGGTDRACRIHGCTFREFGLTGNNFFHCLYIDDAVSVDVVGNRFLEHYGTGFYIQLHDGTEGSKEQRISGNLFGAYGGGVDTAKCINTSNQRPGTVTVIEDNTFEAENHCLELDGDAVVRGNRFAGDGTGATNAFWIIGTESNATIEISDNDFVGTIDNPIRIDWNTSHWKIKGNRFRGTCVDCIQMTSAIAGSRVEVLDNDFTSPTIGDYCVHAKGGGVLTVKGNTFAPTLDASVICVRLSTPGTLSRLTVKDNDFSQPGSVDTSIDVSSVRPGAAGLVISGNYGATGFPTESAGYTAHSDGDLIPHGLGSAACSITPRRFGVSPTGNGGNRICEVSNVDSTNLELELLRITALTAVVVDENINWWAEF